MADVISFGGDVDMSGPSAMMRTIFRYLRLHARDDEELVQVAGQEDVFDAQGGWSFDELSLKALERFRSVVSILDADLPGAIDNWNVDFRPSFYVKFEEFKTNLARRIEQCSGGGHHTRPSADAGEDARAPGRNL